MADSPTPSISSSIDLPDLYHAYEKTITVCPAPADKSYRTLVTFDDSKAQPVHRWYTFKEGYSPRLLNALQSKGIIPRNAKLRLLDPFCGVGTTLLASQFVEQNTGIASAIGVERNPAIGFIANAKLRWEDYRPTSVSALLSKLKKAYRRRKADYPIPDLSTLTTTHKSGKRAFEPAALQQLLFYREWIEQNCAGQPEY